MQQNSYNNITTLIEEYYSGASTDKTIAMLKQTLADNSELPDQLRKEAEAICAIEDAARIDMTPPADFDHTLLHHIDVIAGESTRKEQRWRWVIRTGMAASIAMAAGISVIHHTDNSPNYRVVTDPQEAMQYILNANRLIEESLQKAEASQSAVCEKIISLSNKETNLSD